MSFNIKDNQLLPGSLIRFDGPIGSYAPGLAGQIGIVVSHKKPVFLDVFVAGRMVELNFWGAVPIHGWVTAFTLVAGPDGKPGGGSKPWHR